MDKQAEINEKVAERKEKQKPVNPNGRPPNKLMKDQESREQKPKDQDPESLNQCMVRILMMLYPKTSTKRFSYKQ